ncbi:hypothetical protein BJY16_003711 [Actinoplanes octamycinicus]|uniref:Uncharacterized protein n=1 Tax=Actinoplanes octamycinicus TaxID=135948 RepID=A0A7W7M7U2_9ACTN|nr:hypothetical protein [Actinoplanes octamycinicus]MBB4740252.1 hypothetical protein [Actinoplanes octamycinicus]GIE63465.1 hypothetical protein Aoc01nite_88670 [Actinoplanes octamycinicus]
MTPSRAARGRVTYVAAAVTSAPPDGLRVSLGGDLGGFRRETVWRCAGAGCDAVPLDTYQGGGRREQLVEGLQEMPSSRA